MQRPYESKAICDQRTYVRPAACGRVSLCERETPRYHQNHCENCVNESFFSAEQTHFLLQCCSRRLRMNYGWNVAPCARSSVLTRDLLSELPQIRRRSLTAFQHFYGENGRVCFIFLHFLIHLYYYVSRAGPGDGLLCYRRVL